MNTQYYNQESAQVSPVNPNGSQNSQYQVRLPMSVASATSSIAIVQPPQQQPTADHSVGQQYRQPQPEHAGQFAEAPSLHFLYDHHRQGQPTPPQQQSSTNHPRRTSVPTATSNQLYDRPPSLYPVPLPQVGTTDARFNTQAQSHNGPGQHSTTVSLPQATDLRFNSQIPGQRSNLNDPPMHTQPPSMGSLQLPGLGFPTPSHYLQQPGAQPTQAWPPAPPRPPQMPSSQQQPEAQPIRMGPPPPTTPIPPPSTPADPVAGALQMLVSPVQTQLEQMWNNSVAHMRHILEQLYHDYSTKIMAERVRVEELKGQLSQAQAEKEQTTAKYSQTKTEYFKMKAALADTTASLHKAQSQVMELEIRKGAAEAKFAALEEVLRRRQAADTQVQQSISPEQVLATLGPQVVDQVETKLNIAFQKVMEERTRREHVERQYHALLQAVGMRAVSSPHIPPSGPAPAIPPQSNTSSASLPPLVPTQTPAAVSVAEQVEAPEVEHVVIDLTESPSLADLRSPTLPSTPLMDEALPPGSVSASNINGTNTLKRLRSESDSALDQHRPAIRPRLFQKAGGGRTVLEYWAHKRDFSGGSAQTTSPQLPSRLPASVPHNIPGRDPAALPTRDSHPRSNPIPVLSSMPNLSAGTGFSSSNALPTPSPDLGSQHQAISTSQPSNAQAIPNPLRSTQSVPNHIPVNAQADPQSSSNSSTSTQTGEKPIASVQDRQSTHYRFSTQAPSGQAQTPPGPTRAPASNLSSDPPPPQPTRPASQLNFQPPVRPSQSSANAGAQVHPSSTRPSPTAPLASTTSSTAKLSIAHERASTQADVLLPGVHDDDGEDGELLLKPDPDAQIDQLAGDKEEAEDGEIPESPPAPIQQNALNQSPSHPNPTSTVPPLPPSSSGVVGPAAGHAAPIFPADIPLQPDPGVNPGPPPLSSITPPLSTSTSTVTERSKPKAKTQLSLMHLPLLYDQQPSGAMVCRSCRTREPDSYHLPIAQFPKDASFSLLNDHYVKEHPVACEQTLRLNEGQIMEMRQRMSG